MKANEQEISDLMVKFDGASLRQREERKEGGEKNGDYGGIE